MITPTFVHLSEFQLFIGCLKNYLWEMRLHVTIVLIIPSSNPLHRKDKTVIL